MAGIENIRVGADVLGSDGEKIGSVAQVARDHMLVEKGMLFTKDLYIPVTAITTVDADGRAVLSVAKDQVEDMGWDQPRVSDTDQSGGSLTQH